MTERTTTVQQVIDVILSAVPNALREQTVDTLKAGDAAMPVHGIVTTFTATMDVIRRAEEIGANLIITHEPTFYDHADQLAPWLAKDAVVMTKKALLEERRMAVWRFHDNWHRHQPDGILTGIVRKMGWQDARDPHTDTLFHRPETTLAHLVEELKQIFGLPMVKLIGDPQQRIQHVGLMVGAPGSKWQVKFLSEHAVDVLICGEIVEWMVGEYVRDASLQGRKLSLIVLGHVVSEQAGMQYLVDWLHPKLPALPIQYVEIPDLLTFL
jgi:putative NIF3 family GTP cyclohydrolase 1 type 2